MTFMGLPSFRTAQVVALCGVDVSMELYVNEMRLITIQAIIIDCEHGHINDDSMHTATAAIAAQGVSPVIRIRMTHPDLIKRALDAGAQ